MFFRRKKKIYEASGKPSKPIDKELLEHPLVRLDHELKRLGKEDENGARKPHCH
jgi:hypothetical protein